MDFIEGSGEGIPLISRYPDSPVSWHPGILVFWHPDVELRKAADAAAACVRQVSVCVATLS